jgi:hypothetical protein
MRLHGSFPNEKSASRDRVRSFVLITIVHIYSVFCVSHLIPMYVFQLYLGELHSYVVYAPLPARVGVAPREWLVALSAPLTQQDYYDYAPIPPVPVLVMATMCFGTDATTYGLKRVVISSGMCSSTCAQESVLNMSNPVCSLPNGLCCKTI